MPDGRHHDPHIEGKLIRAGLCEEVALKEHAGPFAELDNRTGHAFGPEGEVRRSVEGDGIEVGDVADLVRPFGSGVLAGHDIAAQVDGDGVGAVHATFLAEGLDWPAALDGRVEFIDALAERLALRHWREQGARLNPVRLRLPSRDHLHGHRSSDFTSLQTEPGGTEKF